jgi:type VI protein secretion system component VasK
MFYKQNKTAIFIAIIAALVLVVLLLRWREVQLENKTSPIPALPLSAEKNTEEELKALQQQLDQLLKLQKQLEE